MGRGCLGLDGVPGMVSATYRGGASSAASTAQRLRGSPGLPSSSAVLRRLRARRTGSPGSLASGGTRLPHQQSLTTQRQQHDPVAATTALPAAARSQAQSCRTCARGAWLLSGFSRIVPYSEHDRHITLVPPIHKTGLFPSQRNPASPTRDSPRRDDWRDGAAGARRAGYGGRNATDFALLSGYGQRLREGRHGANTAEGDHRASGRRRGCH
jgi:hypothetical protein